MCGIKGDIPWVVLGDFNVVLNFDERIGSFVRLNEVEDFSDCVEMCALAEIKQGGRFFTCLTNKMVSVVFSKIDRVMGNEGWRKAYESFMVTYLPEGDFDHVCIKNKVARIHSSSLICGCKIESSRTRLEGCGSNKIKDV